MSVLYHLADDEHQKKVEMGMENYKECILTVTLLSSLLLVLSLQGLISLI